MPGDAPGEEEAIPAGDPEAAVLALPDDGDPAAPGEAVDDPGDAAGGDDAGDDAAGVPEAVEDA